MLTDAGFDFSQTINFSYRDVSRSYVPQPGKVAQDLQAQLADIGVKIKLDVQESGTLLANSKEGKLQFFLLGWGEDYPDATDWYDYHFNANKKDFGTPYPDIVAAMAKGSTSADPAVRQTAYDEVNKLVKQHVPAIPIANGISYAVFKSNVKNVLIGPYNENFQQMANDSGTIVWVQSGEPISLWCGDEEDGETFRVCDLLFSKLLDFKFGTAQSEPQLAEKVTPNADLTEWTLSLKKGVKYTDGTDFTANDVVASFAAMWDYTNADHKGNTGVFTYFNTLFGNFLHAPPPKS
jgi:peptide/nickel transport system substrate-binding protein